MRSVIVLSIALIALSACGSERRTAGSRPTNGGCTINSLLPCQCADGQPGLATCDGTRYGSCVCQGSADGGLSDAGPEDAQVQADAGLVDTGTPDAGRVDTGVRDTGVRDTGVRDTGVRDTGVRDTGVRDTGVRDTGVRDTGPSNPDAGTLPCSDDSQCIPPITVCENRQCVPGCFSTEANALTCPVPGDCNPLTGRCGGSLICFSDAECNPPISVCEVFLCIPGCAQPGAIACGAGTSCDSASGKCL